MRGWDVFESSLEAADSVLGHWAVMDQSDERSVAAATESTLMQLAAIDLLVVNAGITGPNLPLAAYPARHGGE